MGNTEWGLLVRSDDDVRYWLQVAKEHNTCENWDEIGEGLIVTCVLNYVTKSRAAKPKVPTGKYLVMMNMGGPDADLGLPAKAEEGGRRDPRDGQQAQQLAGLPGHGVGARGDGVGG